MFDARTIVHLDWSGPGVVIDLSAVHHDPEALTLVMLAATGCLQAALARPDGPPRLQVLDEASSLPASERTSRSRQARWKIGRAYGVATVAIVPTPPGSRSQADQGTRLPHVHQGLR